MYGDENIVQSAKPESRYSFNSLLGIVYDIFVLAESDFVVCTFSSNVSGMQQFWNLYIVFKINHILVSIFLHHDTFVISVISAVQFVFSFNEGYYL